MALSEPSRCRWCGEPHETLCPYVKALEFDDGSANPEAAGKVSRVEFFSPVELFGPRPPVTPEEGDYLKLGSQHEKS